MATTSDYLSELVEQKTALANNLVTKGVDASADEKFNSLVPKVLDIETSAKIPDEWSEEYYQSVLAKVPSFEELYAERDDSWLPFSEGGENTATGLFLVEKNNADKTLEIGFQSNSKETYKILTSIDGVNWNLFETGTIDTVNTAQLVEINVADIVDEEAITSSGEYQFLVRFECPNITHFRYGARCNTDEYRKVKLVEVDWNLPTMSGIASNLNYGLAYRSYLKYVHNYIIGGNLVSSFYYCYSLKAIKNIYSDNSIKIDLMFQGCYALEHIPFFDVSGVTESASSTFAGCRSLLTIPKLNFNNLPMASGRMFYDCIRLVTIPYINLSKDESINCTEMFYFCYNLQLVPEIFKDLTIKTYANTFSKCTSLKKVPELGDLSNCASYQNMLNECCSIADTVLELDTSVVTNAGCSGIYSTSTKVLEIYNLLIPDSTNAVIAPSIYTERYTFNPNRVPETSTTTVDIGTAYSMKKSAIVEMLESLPTITVARTIKISGMLHYADLSESDVAIATEKGWTVA